MDSLNRNWLTEGLIDFEYKKYVLLAYLKRVRESFNEKKLYPSMSDLLFHYRNLMSVKENKKLLHENFPKRISKTDFDKLQIVYEEIVKDDIVMKEIEDIISFAIPKIQTHLEEGKGLYEDIEDKITISPVGLASLDCQAGFMFIYVHNQSETLIYEYQVTIFETPEERYRGIHTNFLQAATKNIGNTFESIKVELLRKYKNIRNPATYLIDSKFSYPFHETLLPIAKRLLIKQISNPV